MNPEHESASDSYTCNSPSDSPGWFGALRSRFRAFLEKHDEPASPGNRSRLARGMRRFVIISAMVVALLAAFGLGLSWFGGGSPKGKADKSIQSAIQSATQSPTQSSTQSSTQWANQSPTHPPTQSPTQSTDQSADQSANQSADQSGSNPAGAEASAVLSPPPPQPIGPTGHAEVISPSAPAKKTDGK
ncbi:MAG: hypothetical protein ACREAB_04325 [Blastocatellia bacterium]